MQNKDDFLDMCLASDPDSSPPATPPSAWMEQFCDTYEKFLLRFIVRGRPAMLRALLLKQKHLEYLQKAA
jgi:hypothetical protein